MTLLGKIARRGPAEWWRVAEALMLLAFFRLCLAVFPVRRIIATITYRKAVESRAGATETMEQSVETAQRVQWAVSAAARHSMVEFVCFPQSLAGYTMLRWRGVPSTIVYGVKRSSEGELLAHTWLVVGEKTVLGGEEAAGFSEIERWS